MLRVYCKRNCNYIPMIFNVIKQVQQTRSECKKDHSRSSSSCKQNNDLGRLSELNEILEQFSYIEGYTPTKADLHVVKHTVAADLSLSKYPHVLRWYCHMSSFSEAERVSLPEAKGDLQTPISKASEVRLIPTSLPGLNFILSVIHSNFSDNHCLCVNMLMQAAVCILICE